MHWSTLFFSTVSMNGQVKKWVLTFGNTTIII